MRNVICFTINNHELKDELDGNEYLSSELDYKDIKGDTFLCYPPEIYDKFSDFALSRGYNNSEDFWEVDDEGKEADIDWTDGKFHMKENKKMKKLTVEQKTKVIKFAKALVEKKIITEAFPGVYFKIMNPKLDAEYKLIRNKIPFKYDYGRYIVSNKNWIAFDKFAASKGYEYGKDYWEVNKHGDQKIDRDNLSKKISESKIIKENNNYTMISALREIADDLLLQTELLIDRQYGKVEHDAFKNQWYKTANEFEKKFKTIIKSLMKSGQ